VILYRCFAWNERARRDGMDGPLWFPRPYQGEGRHDNSELYGCLYLSDRAVSCVAEQLARFRGQRLTAPLLRRRELPLALAELELDEAVVLQRERLRPSLVATRRRALTQPQARVLYESHPAAAGIRWWSSYESLWANVTLFDRAAAQLRLREVRVLALDDPAVVEAADFFALRVV
jgi:hypothetical protein